MNEIEEIKKMAAEINKGRRARTLHQSDVDRFIELWQTSQSDEKIINIRVYSCEGFLPNAYKWRADICYLSGMKQVDGAWAFGAYATDAKRSRGSGALVTVNGRAA